MLLITVVKIILTDSGLFWLVLMNLLLVNHLIPFRIQAILRRTFHRLFFSRFFFLLVTQIHLSV